MKGQNIGYQRISSSSQCSDRQLFDVKLDRVFEDVASGKSTVNRPQLDECLLHLREGDILHIHSIDRLARSLKDLENIVSKVNAKGVTIIFHKENLTFHSNLSSSPLQTLMFQMLGAFAQFERTLIKERQKEGIAAAKERGQKLGAPAKLNQTQVMELKILSKEHGVDKSALAKEFGISRPTLYKILAN